MSAPSSETSRAAIERLVRERWGQVLAALLHSIRDFELAEDALAEALLAALEHWSRAGVPFSPEAWLLRTARRRAIDRWRAEARKTSLESFQQELANLERLQATADETTVGDEMIADERLRLIFICCHPAIGESARVALTLNSLGGLTTGEIARALLLREATVAQRLVRAKRKIRDAGIPYAVPGPEAWSSRLESVLAVIYLIFNEGYASTTGGTWTREDLCAEAIRLARVLVELMPSEAEAHGLLALLLLHDARRPARTDARGALVTLEDQDRRRWNRAQSAEGEALLTEVLKRGRVGPFQLQAAVSALHNEAPSFAQTDWLQISLLYERLAQEQPTPVVRLNAIVASSMVHGPRAALQALADLDRDGELERYQPFHAARADFHRRLGERLLAAEAYGRALELTHNEVERRFLESRLLEVSS